MDRNRPILDSVKEVIELDAEMLHSWPHLGKSGHLESSAIVLHYFAMDLWNCACDCPIFSKRLRYYGRVRNPIVKQYSTLTK